MQFIMLLQYLLDIVFVLELQLPMSTTTKVVRSNPVHGEVYSIQHYVIKFVSDLRQGRFSLGTLVSSTNKTDCGYLMSLSTIFQLY
jgi:hypothetical protein